MLFKTRQANSLLLGMIAILATCEGGSSKQGDREIDLNVDLDRKTTSAHIAVSNLSSQVQATQRRIELQPTDMSARQTLVDLLIARSQFLGTYDDFDTAFQVVNDTLERGIEPAQASHLHAKLLSTVHRFDDALKELDRADTLGAESTTGLRESIALARGDDATEIIENRAALALQAPSYAAFTGLAAALSSARRFGEADDAYWQALLAYRDVSPFPLAWVAFQRGAMWGESADDPIRANLLYQASVDRLPQYVVGNVHLSELEFASGDADGAIARLQGVVDQTDDPEPASRLAQFLVERDPDLAASYAHRARLGYETLLNKYPLAFADHATEFYLGAGNDPRKALELALLNLSNRKTRRAYYLAIDAALANADTALACRLVEQSSLPTDLECP